MNESDTLVRAIAEAWEDLPALIGPGFAEFSSKVLGCLRLLDTAGDKAREICNELLELFALHPGARERLVDAFAVLDVAVTRNPVQRPRAVGERYVVVPVYYGTNRERTGRHAPNEFYGPGRGEFTLGVVEVAIPDDHKKGRMEKPSLWRLQFSENPSKHVMLLRLDELDRETFTARIRAELAGADEPRALVFIHGYKVDFMDAARRAAQIAADLNFSGLPMLYSWPSEASTPMYTVDETNVDWSRPDFRRFIELSLCDLNLRSVSIVAHSMGNRPLVETLAAIKSVGLPADSARLSQIVFAAPDVDKETFRRHAHNFAGLADRYTLYASSEDVALKTSKVVHKYPRAGDVLPKILLVEGIDSVDATVVDTSLMGHSYFGDNRSVISDLFQLMRHNHGPADRGLTERLQGGVRYWAFT